MDSETCPKCGSELRYRPEESLFRCMNNECEFTKKRPAKESYSKYIKTYPHIPNAKIEGYICPVCGELLEIAPDDSFAKCCSCGYEHNFFNIASNKKDALKGISKMKKFEFMKWMREYEGKSDATINNYIVAFEYAQNHYCEYTGSWISFYDIDDIEKLTSIFSKYIYGDFSQIGKIYSGAVRASLKAYLRFLEYKKEVVNPTSTKSNLPKVILHKKDGTIIESKVQTKPFYINSIDTETANEVENRQPVRTVTHNYLDDIAKIQNESSETITKKGFDFLNKLANLAISNGNSFEDALEKCLTVYTILTGNISAPVTDKNQAYYKKALGKIRKWAFSPNQENHKLIKAYFKAYHRFDEPPMKSEIQRLCSDYNNSPYYVKNFAGTYASLKVDNITSNDKVFEDDGERVWIWEEVEKELLKYEKYFYDPEKD